jgi:hypothetical protein
MENIENFDEKAAIKVISQMIDAAKSSANDNRFFYLLWGFLVLAASLLEFAMLVFLHSPYHYIGWPVLMGVGMVISVFYGFRKYGKSKTTTYIGHFLRYFFIAWGLSLILLLIFVIPGNNQLVQPIILAMYALAAFVSGGVLKFRPLLWGGSLAWPVALVSFFVSFPLQLLITASTVIIAYIIPGFLLKESK